MDNNKSDHGTPSASGKKQAIRVSLFVDDERELGWVEEDCTIMGMTVVARQTLNDLHHLFVTNQRGPVDIVYLDVRAVDGRMLGLLTRLDGDMANHGTKVMVNTEIECLDDIFSCFEQSRAHILVRPSRVDRVLSLSKLKDELETQSL